jgi:hypothetical protein
MKQGIQTLLGEAGEAACKNRGNGITRVYYEKLPAEYREGVQV